MSVRALDDVGRALFGLAGTLTDDPDLAERLVSQAVQHAGDAPGPDWAEAAQVWTVRGLLSTGHTLGEPVAPDVDVPLSSAATDDDLATRLAASSPLQRAVTVLHYGQHLDPAAIARVVGSSEPDIVAYLQGVRRRLAVHTDADALALRRLLHERAALAAQQATVPLRERCVLLEAELEMTRTDLEELRDRLAEAERVAAERSEASRSPDDDDAATEDAAEDTAVDRVEVPAEVSTEVSTEGAAMARPDAPRPYPSLAAVRLLVLLTAVLGVNYLVWRWAVSVHWSAWWIAAPLVLAETYSLSDALLFGFTMWRPRRRPDPGPPPADATADVFITTCAEPLDLVMTTARAAQAMTFPHTVWILDDADRPALRTRAVREGLGYVSRADGTGPAGRASDDTLNRALQRTQGEFVALLDAGQVPAPELLDRTLGYFRDPTTALVQTPPAVGSPGSAGTLLDGSVPIGGNGWGCAFFAGTNAVLRRTALLQAGIHRPVHEFPVAVDDALTTSERVLRRARSTAAADQPAVSEALLSALHACRELRAELSSDAPLAAATARFRRRVHAAARVVEQQLAGSAADLAHLFDVVDEQLAGVTATEHHQATLDELADHDWSPLGALEVVAALVAAVPVEPEHAAASALPASSRSVAGDLATGLRLQRLGWRNVHHDEVLAVRTPRADLATSLELGLRRAQGTIVTTLREKPFTRRGLSLPHKLVHLGAAWSYLSGFAALVYLAAPVVFLVSGVLPVTALDGRLFVRLLPLLVVEQLLFLVAGWDRPAGRGRPRALALFPVSIRGAVTALGAVVLGRDPAVHPPPRRGPVRLLLPQLTAMAALVAAAGLGLARLAAGDATALGSGVTLLWVAVVLVQFGPVLRALHQQGRPPLDVSTSPALYAAGMAPSRGSTGTSTGTVSG